MGSCFGKSHYHSVSQDVTYQPPPVSEFFKLPEQDFLQSQSDLRRITEVSEADEYAGTELEAPRI